MFNPFKKVKRGRMDKKERDIVEEMLESGNTIQEIANELNRAHQTISAYANRAYEQPVNTKISPMAANVTQMAKDIAAIKQISDLLGFGVVPDENSFEQEIISQGLQAFMQIAAKQQKPSVQQSPQILPYQELSEAQKQIISGGGRVNDVQTASNTNEDNKVTDLILNQIPDSVKKQIKEGKLSLKQIEKLSMPTVKKNLKEMFDKIKNS